MLSVFYIIKWIRYEFVSCLFKVIKYDFFITEKNVQNVSEMASDASMVDNW